MAAVVVHVEGKNGFVAGLDWRPLLQFHAGKGKRVSEIRQFSESDDATRYVSIEKEIQQGSNGPVKEVTAGFLSSVDEEECSGEVSNYYSFAALLSREFPRGNKIVAWKIETGPQDDKTVVVVLESGMPVLDKVFEDDEARSRVSNYLSSGVYDVYTNYLPEFGMAEVLEPQQLFAQWPKEAKLGRIPANILPAVATLGLVSLAFFGYTAWTDYQETQRQYERMLAAQRAQRDPVAEYLAQLEPLKNQIGYSSSSLLLQMDSLLNYPVAAKGWVLQGISCNPDKCIATWADQGGYKEEIADFLKDQTPLVDLNQTGILSRIQFQFDSMYGSSGVESREELPSANEFQSFINREVQVWAKSGVPIALGNDLEVWPKTEVIMPEDVSIRRRAIIVDGSRDLVRDFVLNYGGNVFWDKFDVISSLGTDTPLRYRVEGNFYVR